MRRVLAEYEAWLNGTKEGRLWYEDTVEKKNGVVYIGKNGELFSMVE